MTVHESEEELERVLAIKVPARVSDGFNDAVMRQIHATSGRRMLAALVELFAEPIVPLAIVLVTIMALLMSTEGIRVAVALAPILFWISWRLFRTYERLTLPRV
ncbi:MAG TPA: hypothetical protein VGQ76_16610 [Thermoanaerobaculia bacterium]|jgi:hypothetical protein|nr:hypothetical protein [Thermoanaerobaculia bacterium]